MNLKFRSCRVIFKHQHSHQTKHHCLPPPNSDLAAPEKSDGVGVDVEVLSGSVAGVVESAWATNFTLSFAGVVVVLSALDGVVDSALGSSVAVPPNLTWREWEKNMNVRKHRWGKTQMRKNIEVRVCIDEKKYRNAKNNLSNICRSEKENASDPTAMVREGNTR